MFSNVKWLFFDLGSTLLDESACDKAVIEFSIVGSSVDYSSFEACMKKHASLNRPAYNSALWEFALPKAKWDSSLERMYSGVPELLGKLSQKYQLAVLANQLPGVAQRLEQHGIRKYFSFILSSAEFGLAKPEEKIFLEALRLADCEANQAIMIGDRLDNDILPAMNLGMNTVWVRQGFGGCGNPDLLPRYPDVIIDNILQLTDIM